MAATSGKPDAFKATIVALFDYKGTTDDELNFRKGDTFWVVNDENPDWWLVALPHNPSTTGYVPTTYIQISENSHAANINAPAAEALDRLRDKAINANLGGKEAKSSRKNVARSESEEEYSESQSANESEEDGSGSESDTEDEDSEDGTGSSQDETGSESESGSDTNDDSQEAKDRGRRGRRLSLRSQKTKKKDEKISKRSGKSTPFIIPTSTASLKPVRLTFSRRTKGHALAPPSDLTTTTAESRHAKGAAGLPMGIRASTLAKTREEGIGATANYLIPDLHPSNLSFVDLKYDYRKQKLRPLPAHLTLAFSLLDARNIPTPHPSSGIRVLGRHVRMALFDKMHVLSNIHSVQGVWVDVGGGVGHEIWRFSRKASILFPKDDENTCFLRTNDVDIRLSVLFELCIVVRFDDDSDPTELSCGWGLLPLFTADGGPIENKTYEIKLYGGTPFEKGIPLGDMGGERKGFLQSLINPPRPPRLNIRVWKLGRSASKDLNLLPTPFIHLLSLLPLLTVYRRILAHTLLHPSNPHTHHDHPTPTFPTSFTNSAALAQFLRVVDTPDLTSLLVEVWERVWKGLKRREKRDVRGCSVRLEECLRAVGGVEGLVEVEGWRGGDEERAQDRHTYITAYQATGILESCTRNPQRWGFKPLNVEEEITEKKRRIPAQPVIAAIALTTDGANIKGTTAIRIVEIGTEQADRSAAAGDIETAAANPSVAVALVAGSIAHAKALAVPVLISPERIEDDEDFESVQAAVRTSMSKYGVVLDMKIPRGAVPGAGKIFVRYSEEKHTEVAMAAFGRSERVVLVAPYEESKYVADDFGKADQILASTFKLWIGGIPPSVTVGDHIEDALVAFFNQTMIQLNITTGGGAPVLAAQINHDKNYAFCEVSVIFYGFNVAKPSTNGVLSSKARKKRLQRWLSMESPLQGNLSGFGDQKIINQSRMITFRSMCQVRGKYLIQHISVSSDEVIFYAYAGSVSTNVPDSMNKIFVGGLSNFLSEEQVMEILESFGQLRAFNLVKDATTGASKGFAFCEYIDPNSTDMAYQGLNGMELCELRLVVVPVIGGAVGARRGIGDGEELKGLNGVVRALDDLKELGVDIVWLGSVFESPMLENGYDITNYLEVASNIGTILEFHQLLAQTHERQMKLVMDVVLTQTSPMHSWFAESRKDKTNSKRSWYCWRQGRTINGVRMPPNNWACMAGGSAWSLDKETNEWYLHLFSATQPTLNWGNGDVRQAMSGVLRFWLDRGVDGFRIVDTTVQYQPAGHVLSERPYTTQYLHELEMSIFTKYDLVTCMTNVKIVREDEMVGRGYFAIKGADELRGLEEDGEFGWDLLSLQLLHVARNARTSFAERQKRQSYINYLQSLVKTVSPSAQLHIVGSYATQLDLCDADLDIVIKDPNRKAYDPLDDYHHLIQSRRRFPNIDYRHRALVPILKFADGATGLYTDLTFERGGIEAVPFINSLTIPDRYMEPLVVLFKLLVHTAHPEFERTNTRNPDARPVLIFDDPSLGGLGGFAIVNWSKAFLNLHWPPTRRRSLSAVFMEFLSTYARFDYTAFSISHTGYESRVAERYPKEIVIVDPLIVGRNVAAPTGGD
ncbi:hypothetical protein HDV00_003043 [Rhizophlyctis rosea]|nr:hypothetical protein HDV00_003043 [Rhizophlyctis rosea]